MELFRFFLEWYFVARLGWANAKAKHNDFQHGYTAGNLSLHTNLFLWNILIFWLHYENIINLMRSNTIIASTCTNLVEKYFETFILFVFAKKKCYEWFFTFCKYVEVVFRMSRREIPSGNTELLEYFRKKIINICSRTVRLGSCHSFWFCGCLPGWCAVRHTQMWIT